MKKEWLTPEELATETGFSRQTINKWVKRERWITKPKPGVQGGKARLILRDERVKSFLNSTRHATEPSTTYHVSPNSLPSLLMTSLQEMNREEKEKLYAILLREGIQGLLRRLDINVDKP